jgi:hypothetical protein
MMIDLEMAHRDLGSMEERFACPAGDEWWSSFLLVAQEAMAAPARAQEDAAIEAQDILEQADEALVLG